MNFQGLKKVEKADWYIDLAFRNAGKKAAEIKSAMRRRPDTIKRAELAKVSEIRRILRRHLDMILKSFPSIDTLDEFYMEMIRAAMDYAELKKSLGALRWAEQKVDFFSDQYHNKIARCRDFSRMTGYSREYYGRISSVMKQVKRQLEYLEQARKTMKDFPSIKTSIFTVCIAGFPNVGKTTLLSKLTPANPEIADYAFTTKKLNIGYATINNNKVQFIDTPGTLDRFQKMNPVEKQAYLALKYCADLVVFVFDPSDRTYAREEQLKLLKSTQLLGKDVVVYVSKTDLPHEKLQKMPKSAQVMKDLDELKARISELMGR
ncbi:50S ribosome-binding GTPase [Candidatus Woesearchaeota archaeon]|nr:50S ribosome-binding GTPase [Candidatus Woesearchaeota archaeon]